MPSSDPPPSSVPPPPSDRKTTPAFDSTVPMIARGLGWRPDPHDDRDFKARALFGARRDLPGEALRLEGCVPGILDQGPTSSCVGHGLGTAIDVRLRALGKWDAPLTSKRGIYTLARILARIAKTVPLSDEGSHPRLAMKSILAWGVPTDQRWPFDPARINDELPLDVLMQASAHKLDKWWRIDSMGRERVEDICQALAAGYPVPFGVDVDDRFLAHKGRDPVGPSDPARVVGGHMMCLVGYTTTPQGRRRFRSVNSWGIGWGDAGMFWAEEEFVTDPSFGDAYVMQVN